MGGGEQESPAPHCCAKIAQAPLPPQSSRFHVAVNVQKKLALEFEFGCMNRAKAVKVLSTVRIHELENVAIENQR